MHNPMNYDWVRVAYNGYPDNIQMALSEVSNFAHHAPNAIESVLGEYSGSDFDKQKLIHAVTTSIRSKDISSTWSWYGNLKHVFAKANLPESALDRVQDITEEVALARIAQAIHTDANGKEVFHEHGHHGRQYIARDVVARVIREVLPQPTLLGKATQWLQNAMK